MLSLARLELSYFRLVRACTATEFMGKFGLHSPLPCTRTACYGAGEGRPGHHLKSNVVEKSESGSRSSMSHWNHEHATERRALSLSFLVESVRVRSDTETSGTR
jgi:hypothetical protein